MMRTILAVILCLGPASAAAAADAPAAAAGPVVSVVRHVPPSEATGGEPLRLAAVVEDAWVETAIVAHYRPARSNAPYAEVPFERSSAGGYYATIPAAAVQRPGVEYYVAGVDRDGHAIAHFASAAQPHEVRVEPATELRWIEAERRRLGDRESAVKSTIEAVDFGHTWGTDRYLRGEMSWTHRLVTQLYSFSLGYGFIAGTTPDGRFVDFSLDGDYRYGFGEARLRLGRGLWVDSGALLGFSQRGFAPGVRSTLTIGDDWRSCVQLGFEAIRYLGNTYSLKLQWDTAAPFLMAARARATDLPGAALHNGAIIDYEISYPVTERLQIGAQVSYAIRDRRTGGPGVGLSASLEF